MALTLKEILDAAMHESGMPTEAAYASSNDDAIKRMLYIANRALEDLARYPWQVLLKRYTFTLTDSTTYSLPPDYRAIVPDTMYTDSHLWPVDFPTDRAEWAYLKASGGGTGTRVQMRLLADQIEIYEPSVGEEIAFEYISSKPVLDTDGVTYKQRFAADTDTCVLDDELLTLAIIWRYKKLVGLTDWQVDLAEYKTRERVLKGQEAGAQTIVPGRETLTGPYYDLWRPVPNV